MVKIFKIEFKVNLSLLAQVINLVVDGELVQRDNHNLKMELIKFGTNDSPLSHEKEDFHMSPYLSLGVIFLE